jgi:catechol 2,3-dioxygenase-like lactoylglutathione lyase family enzyme
MATRINHMAITSAQWPMIGRFYEAVFGLKSAGKSRPLNGFTVGDGYVGLNINPRRDRMVGGLDHFGVMVDDVARSVERMRTKWGVDMVKRPQTRPFAAYTAHDPDGNIFDLAQKGENTMSSLYAEQEAESESKNWHKDRYINKFAYRVLNAEKLADFYADVLGLSPTNSASSDKGFQLTDGRVTLALIPWKVSSFEGTSMLHAGADHIGFKVESMDAFQAHLQEVIDLNPLIGPMPIGGSAEAKRRKQIFTNAATGKLQIADPDGVWIDVTDE